MKKIYTLLFCLALLQVGLAQTLIVVHPTLDYSGHPDAAINANVTIQNAGSTSLEVIVKRISQIKAIEHESYFCWAVCYDSSTSLSPDPIPLTPGQSTISFEGWIFPHMTVGDDTVTYAFYDRNGNSDTLILTFTYQFSTGVQELASVKNSLRIFVNENKTASVNYVCNSLSNSKIQISNLLGKVVKEISIEDKVATIKVPLNELSQGVYFCGLNTDGKFVATKKFILAQ